MRCFYLRLLINACNVMVMYLLQQEFLLFLVPRQQLLQNPRYRRHSINHCQPLCPQSKTLGISKFTWNYQISERNLLIPVCFIKRPCLYISVYLASLPSLQSEIKFSHYVKKLKQQFTSVCALMVAYFLCVGAYKCDVMVVIKIGAIHGCLFCVVPIILVLWY